MYNWKLGVMNENKIRLVVIAGKTYRVIETFIDGKFISCKVVPHAQ